MAAKLRRICHRELAKTKQDNNGFCKLSMDALLTDSLRKTLRYLVTLHCAIEMWLLGVWTVREWKVLNCDFDFAAKDSEENIVLEPLSDENRVNQYSIRSYVSNHISIVDTLFFIVKIYPSFLAKSQVFHHPLVGPPARALNCVFLNRKSAVDR